MTERSPSTNGEAPGNRVGDELDLSASDGDGEAWEERSTTLVRQLAADARRARLTSLGGARDWLVDTTVATAERVKLRDRDLLRRHHPGADDRQVGENLIRNASRATATVGGVSGAIIAAEQLLPPTLISVPFEILAETALVVGIELKLVGELHAAADRPLVAGGPAERSMLLLGSWIEQRGVQPSALLDSAHDLFGRGVRDQAIRALRDRLSRRLGRNLATAIPLLVGAAAGAELNRRATLAVGASVATDLSLR